MTLFRPCIDLHEGHVKQIVGGSLTDSGNALKTNFVATQGADYFANRYRLDGLTGGHVISLGSGNESAALAALHAYPLGLQLGGGIDEANAERWLEAGASHVIVTSWLFPQGQFEEERLKRLSTRISREKLVVDLSCRRVGIEWRVAIHRWQTITDIVISPDYLDKVSRYCSELLIHAADVEGLQAGMDLDLIRHLADWGGCPITYAGGARDLGDLQLCEAVSQGKVDLTIGSALDLFGGRGARYQDCVAFNQQRGQNTTQAP
jgi:phosphoribosylformimino-5-aminoimidazole carboxamide ribotide isomerase